MAASDGEPVDLLLGGRGFDLSLISTYTTPLSSALERVD